MSLTAADYEYVRCLVRREAGIVLGPEKQYLLDTRLALVARDLGAPSVEAVVAEARRAPSQSEAVRRLVEGFTTNETSFFRDAHPFAALGQTILPELIAARSDRRMLNVWCGAASTGQEPYSLAMMLLEHFPELRGWRVRILATDLCRTVLERARAGRYTNVEAHRGLPPETRARWFTRDGDEWVIDEAVRRMVDFEEFNLLRPWRTLPPMDIVLLRNVLIYFSDDDKRRVAERVHDVMHPAGYALFGSSETPHLLGTRLQPVSIGRTLCYRTAHYTPPAACAPTPVAVPAVGGPWPSAFSA